LPVIRVSRKDLINLVGVDLDRDELVYLLSMLKCEVEFIDGDVIEYEATHDRPDLYSVEGLARGIRLLLGIEKSGFIFVDEGYKAYNVDVSRRPYIAFTIVKNVNLDEEAVIQMMQLQEKLATIYGRNRRKASIGVYDLDKFRMPIYYELRDPLSTRFTPLNSDREMNLKEILEETDKGREYGWLIRDWDKYPVIRDADGKILSMPPIINSEDTKVTIGSRNILIDSTGTDPELVVNLVTIMATSIVERSVDKRIYFVETELYSGEKIKAPRSVGKNIEVNINDINSLIGIKLSRSKIVELLTRMGYKIVRSSGKKLVLEAPVYRLDTLGWVDVAEDIAIGYGYDKIGQLAHELPPAIHAGRIHRIEYLSRLFRKLLVSYGYVEVVNYMMSNPEIQLRLFSRSDDMIRVSNPKIDKYTGLRIWLTPGLLEVVKENVEKEKEIRIFEIGDVAIPDNSMETGARIERRVGIGISHDKATLTDGLSIVNTLLKNLGLSPVYRKSTQPGFLSQRCADVFVNDVYAGFVGEIHPEILLKMNIDKPVVVSELVLNNLLTLFIH